MTSFFVSSTSMDLKFITNPIESDLHCHSSHTQYLHYNSAHNIVKQESGASSGEDRSQHISNSHIHNPTTQITSELVPLSDNQLDHHQHTHRNSQPFSSSTPLLLPPLRPLYISLQSLSDNCANNSQSSSRSPLSISLHTTDGMDLKTSASSSHLKAGPLPPSSFDYRSWNSFLEVDSIASSADRTMRHNSWSSDSTLSSYFACTLPKSKAFLTTQDIENLFFAASSNRNIVKSKRDSAMLCLLLDLKFPCQKIADLRFKHVRGIVDGDFDGIFCFSSDGSDEIMGGLPCSARTVKAIQDWVMEVDSAFGWKYKDDAPLFIPLAFFGESRIPRRVALKRDAVSKVFLALKATSGVWMTKVMVNNTQFF